MIELLLVKDGEVFGGPGGERLLDDASQATLTFSDMITRVTASQSYDDSGLLSNKIHRNKYSVLGLFYVNHCYLV